VPTGAVTVAAVGRAAPPAVLTVAAVQKQPAARGVVAERPSLLQMAGCALVLVASYAGTARR
jgi:hypothetical protein